MYSTHDIKIANSEEDPLPEDLRKSGKKKKDLSKSKSKKSSYFDESEGEDDEAPLKIKKLSKSAEKLSHKELKQTKPDKKLKPVTPKKQTVSVDDFFGSAPIHRSTGKPAKRKQCTGDDVLNNLLKKYNMDSPKKKAVTPQKQAAQSEDVIPPSLEKKKSSYRSFMQREGPKALGTKEIPEGQENCFEGMTFVITGVLESIEREQAQDIIQRYGGKVTSAVSKKTSYLIIGRDPGASKTSKANSLGTKTIEEDGFFDLIRNTPGKKSSYDQTPEKHSVKKSKTSKTESPAPKPFPLKPSIDMSQSSVTDSQNSQTSSHSQASPSTQTPSGSPLTKGRTLTGSVLYSKRDSVSRESTNHQIT
ncbi:Replication factor C subunit 1 [Exaiptasia diaphana]|nr:Replication factor C subunit 1 [Exaiptasia diaphana]